MPVIRVNACSKGGMNVLQELIQGREVTQFQNDSCCIKQQGEWSYFMRSGQFFGMHFVHL